MSANGYTPETRRMAAKALRIRRAETGQCGRCPERAMASIGGPS